MRHLALSDAVTAYRDQLSDTPIKTSLTFTEDGEILMEVNEPNERALNLMKVFCDLNKIGLASGVLERARTVSAIWAEAPEDRMTRRMRRDCISPELKVVHCGRNRVIETFRCVQCGALSSECTCQNV